jgi:hypothetical protein
MTNDIGEYNPDEGCDIPFCLVCGKENCECPPETDDAQPQPTIIIDLVEVLKATLVRGRHS